MVLERAEDSGEHDARLIEGVLFLPDQDYLDMLEPAHNGSPTLDQISQQYPQLECCHGMRH